jgi:hypothetical protein
VARPRGIRSVKRLDRKDFRFGTLFTGFLWSICGPFAVSCAPPCSIRKDVAYNSWQLVSWSSRALAPVASS